MFVEDTTGTLAKADIAALEATTASFDLKVIVTANESRAGLDAKVAQMVTSPNTVAIGVDPLHRYTFTHFGTGTGIARSDFQAVAKSGNPAFKTGQWADGIKAIVTSAQASQRVERAATVPVIIQQPQTVVEKPVPVLPFVVGFGVLALVGALVWRWNRKRQSELADTIDGFKSEAAELRSRNVKEQVWAERIEKATSTPEPKPVKLGMSDIEANRRAARPTPEERDFASTLKPSTVATAPRPARRRRHLTPVPAPAPVIVQGGGSDLATGILLGQAISRPAPVVEHHHHRHHTPAPEPSRSSSYDGGSSSSSWDSGGGFSGGSGGGGFDSGGGGFSGGGGGGDF